MRVTGKWLFLMALCLALTACGSTKEEGAEPAAENAHENAFAYLTSANELALWIQGKEEPALLTGRWMDWKKLELLEAYDSELLEEMMQSLDWSQEDILCYSPDKSRVYFGSGVWFYPTGSSLLPIYDLYCFLPDGSSVPVAERVLDFRIDRAGNIWYSRLETEFGEEWFWEDGREVLYRYDGRKHHPVGELGAAGEGAWQIASDGSLAVFRRDDGGLYEWSGEDVLQPKRLAEAADQDFCLTAGGERIICRNGNRVSMISLDGDGEADTKAVEGEWEEVYILDEAGENLLLMEKESAVYGDILTYDGTEEDREALKLWKLLMQEELFRGIERCRIGLYDTVRGEYLSQETGYLLESLEYEQMKPIKGPYYLEMLEEDFEGIPLSCFFPGYTAAELVESYEMEGADALFYAADQDCLYERARGFAAGRGWWQAYEMMELSGQREVRKTYNRETGQLYIRIFRLLEDEEGEMLYAGEDVYELDQQGSCRKVVEAAGQALVIRDRLYYTRSYGEEVGQRLFCLEDGDVIAEGISIDMDRMRKSAKSGHLFYLVGSLGLGDPSSAVLNVYDGRESRELEEKVYRFLLYGDDSVALLQSKLEEDSEEFAYMVMSGEGYEEGRLIVLENGEKQTVDEQVMQLIRIPETE
ncbi:MAG: hypothetical protein MR430_07760 [Lachnospiraceae bacterium]|nr:hypothetical protein [Lachnospiraceae bacterium]